MCSLVPAARFAATGSGRGEMGLRTVPRVVSHGPHSTGPVRTCQAPFRAPIKDFTTFTSCPLSRTVSGAPAHARLPCMMPLPATVARLAHLPPSLSRAGFVSLVPSPDGSLILPLSRIADKIVLRAFGLMD